MDQQNWVFVNGGREMVLKSVVMSVLVLRGTWVSCHGVWDGVREGGQRCSVTTLWWCCLGAYMCLHMYAADYTANTAFAHTPPQCMLQSWDYLNENSLRPTCVSSKYRHWLVHKTQRAFHSWTLCCWQPAPCILYGAFLCLSTWLY